MRSCLGTILLIILITAIVCTAAYHWVSNSSIEFSARNEGEPELNQSNTDINQHTGEPKVKKPDFVEDGVMPVIIDSQNAR